MSKAPRSMSDHAEREAQALREVGATDVRRGVAIGLGVVFLATIALVPLVDALHQRGTGQWPVGDLVSDLGAAAGSIPQVGMREFNRRTKAAFDRFETNLEETSWLRRTLVPVVQEWLTAEFGIGNEQVVVGRSGWLYFRADLEHVIGGGFLARSALARRAAGGDLWSSAPQPDPGPAIIQLADRMRERGAMMIVLPTPVKPTVQPEPLIDTIGWGRARVGSHTGREVPLRNASFDVLVQRLREAGITVFDPAPLLLAAQIGSATDSYLRTDTHWSPAGVERVAAALARRIEEAVELSGEVTALRRRHVVLEGLGDTARLLGLPDTQSVMRPERITTALVLAPGGTVWRPVRGAEVLVVGDSFSNVYADASLGWGSGAGLAEQLAFELQRPVDRIAVNAGGAAAAREALHRTLIDDPERLVDTRVVVYQFATRELSQGDWRTE